MCLLPLVPTVDLASSGAGDFTPGCGPTNVACGSIWTCIHHIVMNNALSKVYLFSLWLTQTRPTRQWYPNLDYGGKSGLCALPKGSSKLCTAGVFIFLRFYSLRTHRELNLEHGKVWYNHQEKKVQETDQFKLLWDFNIQTDKLIEALRSDTLWINKEVNHTWIIDIAVPGDARVKEK